MRSRALALRHLLSVTALAATLAWGSPSHAQPADSPNSCFKGLLRAFATIGEPQSLWRFEQKYATLNPRYIGENGNEKLRRLAEGELDGAELFFEMENPILKEMNDFLFNHPLATAITNKYQDILFRRLLDSNTPHAKLLRENLIGRYGDWKSARLAFKADTPEIRDALSKIYRESAGEFAEFAKRIRLDERAAHGQGFALDPATWALAGIGKSAYEAGTAARVARSLVKPGDFGSLKPIQFEKETAFLIDRLEQIEKMRTRLESDFEGTKLLQAVNTADGQKLRVSDSAIAVIRGLKVKWGDPHYIGALRAEFKRHFGVNVSEDQAYVIRSYFHQADTFSPGVFVTKRTVPDYSKSTHGAVYTDFAGVGAENLGSTMDSLIPDSAWAKLPDEEKARYAVRNAVKGNQRVTVKLDSNRYRVSIAGREIGNDAPSYFSGDDGVTFPQRTMNSDDKFRFIERFSDQAKAQRFAFVPQRFVDGVEIPGHQKEELGNLMLGMEKVIRKKLVGNFFGPAFDDVVLAFDLVDPGQDLRRGKIQLLVTSKKPLAEWQLKKLHREFEGALRLMNQDRGKAFEIGPVRVRKGKGTGELPIIDLKPKVKPGLKPVRQPALKPGKEKTQLPFGSWVPASAA